MSDRKTGSGRRSPHNNLTCSRRLRPRVARAMLRGKSHKGINKFSNKQINKSMQNAEKIKDIHERIYQFILRVLNLTKSLPKTTQNLILIAQITRSAASMGANDQEADGTDNKEGKETNYWLRLIEDTNPTFKNRMESLRQEGKEIVKIVSTIILNSKRK